MNFTFMPQQQPLGPHAIQAPARPYTISRGLWVVVRVRVWVRQGLRPGPEARLGPGLGLIGLGPSIRPNAKIGFSVRLA
jgi:hypothetical protein